MDIMKSTEPPMERYRSSLLS